MSAVYPSALEQMLQAGVDISGGTVKVQLVDSTYVYSAAHDFFDDVGGRLGTPVTLTGKTFTAGVFRAAALTYTGVALGAVVAAIIGYLDSGVEATSKLLWFDDENADGSPISYTGTGSGIPISWPTRCFSI